MVDDGRRLQLLDQIGRYPEVLAEVERLRQHMDGLSERSDREEYAHGVERPRNAARYRPVRRVADRGLAAVPGPGRGDSGLAGRPATRRTWSWLATRFNDYGPLLSLDRIADARRLLLECRRMFDEHNQYEYLGKILGALADLESQVGHLDRAVDAEHSALRYTYLAGQP